MTSGMFDGLTEQPAEIAKFTARCGTRNCSFSMLIYKDREEDARLIATAHHMDQNAACAAKSSEFIEHTGL